jgi:hypothetical protein
MDRTLIQNDKKVYELANHKRTSIGHVCPVVSVNEAPISCKLSHRKSIAIV